MWTLNNRWGKETRTTMTRNRCFQTKLENRMSLINGKMREQRKAIQSDQLSVEIKIQFSNDDVKSTMLFYAKFHYWSLHSFLNSSSKLRFQNTFFIKTNNYKTQIKPYQITIYCMQPYYTQPFTNPEEDINITSQTEKQLLRKNYRRMCEQLGFFDQGNAWVQSITQKTKNLSAEPKLSRINLQKSQKSPNNKQNLPPSDLLYHESAPCVQNQHPLKHNLSMNEKKFF